MKRVVALYEGVVQGVGFRSTVARHAARFKVRGSVKNLEDGRVEVEAFGKSAQIAHFLEQIEQQPGHARIRGVATHYDESSKAPPTFEIVYE